MKQIIHKTKIKVEFYDVDSMNIVWHGNYVKFLEIARCRLLEHIGYTYNDMKQDGYGYPIVKIDLKYISPAFFGNELTITTKIIDYDCMLKISYEIYNNTTNKVCAKANTSQAVVKLDVLETQYSLHKEFLEKINEYYKNI